MKKSLSVIAGIDKNGQKEKFEELTLSFGEAISIVGPTGSGKTSLITDIELLSQGDSITKRKILIDGEVPTDEIRYSPLHKPIVMITQNTKCISDLYVEEFLEIHARARGITDEKLVEDTIDFSNLFTGEEIKRRYRVTELSGGQTRALLFADAFKIGAAPIILLDEIENAGINKNEIIERVKGANRLVIFVTHDPIIALRTEKRVVMKHGSIIKVVQRSTNESKLLEELLIVDSMLNRVREKIRVDEVSDEDSIIDLLQKASL